MRAAQRSSSENTRSADPRDGYKGNRREWDGEGVAFAKVKWDNPDNSGFYHDYVVPAPACNASQPAFDKARHLNRLSGVGQFSPHQTPKENTMKTPTPETYKISWNQLVEACRRHLFDTPRIPIVSSCCVDDDEGTITFTYDFDLESYDVVLDFDTSVEQHTEENETVDFDTPFLPINPNHSVKVYTEKKEELNIRFYGIINPFS